MSPVLIVYAYLAASKRMKTTNNRKKQFTRQSAERMTRKVMNFEKNKKKKQKTMKNKYDICLHCDFSRDRLTALDGD